jgi:4-hydroxy-2-oxoheptanedioate aldolase
VFVSFRSLLVRADPVPVGAFVKLPAIEIVEILKLAGFDFIVLDSEHSMLTLAELNHLIAVAQGLQMPAIVRVPDHGYGDAQRVLDAGAAGIMVPHVSTAETAGAVTRQALHPPRGTRGSGSGMRAGDWGTSGRAEYVRRGVEEAMRIPMIEEPAGAANVEAICAAPGVDALFFGPGDMSLAMGVQAADDAVTGAMQRVARVAGEHGIPVGTTASGAADARRKLEMGYRFLLVGNDTGMLLRSARTAVESIRDA